MDAKRCDRAVPSSVRDGRRRVVPSVVPSVVHVVVARVAEMLGPTLAELFPVPLARLMSVSKAPCNLDFGALLESIPRALLTVARFDCSK